MPREVDVNNTFNLPFRERLFFSYSIKLKSKLGTDSDQVRTDRAVSYVFTYVSVTERRRSRGWREWWGPVTRSWPEWRGSGRRERESPG